MGAGGLLLFAWVSLKKRFPPREVFPIGLLLAFAIGGAFIVLFSYMTQTNGYILYLPLPLAIFFLAVYPSNLPSRAWLGVIFAAYFLISLSFSDLVPRSVRLWAMASVPKPIGTLLLLGLLSWLVLRPRRVVSGRSG